MPHVTPRRGPSAWAISTVAPDRAHGQLLPPRAHDRGLSRAQAPHPRADAREGGAEHHRRIHRAPQFLFERRRARADLRRPRGRAHVDAHADDDVRQRSGVGLRFSEDTGELAGATHCAGRRHHQVVGPLDHDRQPRGGVQAFGHRHTGRQRQGMNPIARMRLVGVEHHRDVEPGAGRRKPVVPAASAPGSLLAGDDQRAIRCALQHQLCGQIVGRRRDGKVDHARAKRRRVAVRPGVLEPVGQTRWVSVPRDRSRSQVGDRLDFERDVGGAAPSASRRRPTRNRLRWSPVRESVPVSHRPTLRSSRARRRSRRPGGSAGSSGCRAG